MLRHYLVLFLSMLVLASCSAPDDTTQSSNSGSVDALLSTMTLEQKVGQMLQGEIKHVSPDDVRRFGLGSILNGGGSFPRGEKSASVDDWLALADSYYHASIDTSAGSAGIPIIWGTDAVHGHNNVIGATIFPHNIGLGAANDPALAAAIAAATAREVKATGIDWIFAPTLAVAKDPRWGRTYESFSSEPQTVARFAAPLVSAIQGEGLIATAKHFIGDGGTFRGVDQGDTRMNLERLLAEHGQGYYEAIDADVKTVMATFNSWNGEKVHGHKALLQDVLKGQLKFQGFVVSDWNGIGQVQGCSNDNCAKAINAGIDMVMAPEDWKSLHENIVAQVRAGEIPMARIDDAVRRILNVKSAMGLLDRRAPSEEAAPLRAVIGSAEHRAIARDAVRRSQVLLKNRDGLLPLSPASTLLVTGPAADDIGRQSGGWTVSWQGTGNTNADFPGGTSILDAISAQVEAAGGEVLTTVNASQAASIDAIIYVFGETPYAEGVGDIESLAWQQRSQRDFSAMESFRAQGIPVVAVFLSGRPRWTNAELNASDAFVAAWLPGSEGGGVADTLLRAPDGSVQYPFTGRLPMSWPRFDLNSDDPDLPVYAELFPIGYGLDAGEAVAIADLDTQPIGGLKDTSEVLFEGGVREPWMLYLADERDPALAAGPSSANSAAGRLKVSLIDKDVQEDARRLTWSEGDTPTGLYFGRGQPWDASALAAADGDVSLTLKRVTEVNSPVLMRASCGADCSAEIDVSTYIQALPRDQWRTLAVPLSCLAFNGLDMAQVMSPLGLFVESDLTLELAGAVVTDAPVTADQKVSCQPE